MADTLLESTELHSPWHTNRTKLLTATLLWSTKLYSPCIIGMQVEKMVEWHTVEVTLTIHRDTNLAEYLGVTLFLKTSLMHYF